MTIKQILSVIFIFLLGVAGWITLGTTSELRGGNYYASLDYQVEQLWGSHITQKAPSLSVKVPGSKSNRILMPQSNLIKVDLQLEQRKKGLIWYPTYKVKFDGVYTIKNTDAVSQSVRLHFPLPSESATYDHFDFMVDGESQSLDLKTSEGVNYLIELAPDQTRSFTIQYQTRGLRAWQYFLSNEGKVKNLDLLVTTNFLEVDYQNGSLSPMSVEIKDNLTELRWTANDFITKQNVAILMPEKINPGPLSARMSFFAPVCLLFFFVLISALSVIKKINIHPMHYLFVTAGFFAFHLSFAYMVDVINVHLAFLISSIISVGLVILYLRSALGKTFPWRIAATGQFFYLVLFSYSFFIKGMTGLTVTVGSILTLAVLMMLTAKTDWNTVFVKKSKQNSDVIPGAGF
ncbi:MAG: inner membrane CreD family protein [Gammaproteobacteria bacterium]